MLQSTLMQLKVFKNKIDEAKKLLAEKRKLIKRN